MSKTILITGTSAGFGKDAAESLAKVGHHVFATMRDVSGRSRAEAAELRSKGIEVLELDVTKDGSVDGAFNALHKAGAKLDVLINNAGLFASGLSETFNPEQVREMFEVNVFGLQRVTRAALPKMRSTTSMAVAPQATKPLKTLQLALHGLSAVGDRRSSDWREH